MKKICAECGKEFEATGNNQRYCCKKCAWIAHYLTIKKIRPLQNCVICGKEFEPIKTGQKTCGSPECQKAIRSRVVTAKTGKPRRRKNMSDKAWNKLSPSERWQIMTLGEVCAEGHRLHLTYGQMQCLYHYDKLPEDFGKRGVK